MKYSTFALFGNSIITSQFFNGGKMIRWKVGAVNPRWRSYWWKLFPYLRSIIDFTLFRFYKSENLQYKLKVQVQVEKLVLQVTSTSTIYKWGKIGPSREVHSADKKKISLEKFHMGYRLERVSFRNSTGRKATFPHKRIRVTDTECTHA